MLPHFIEVFLARLAGAIRRRLFPPPHPPYFYLGRRWSPGLLFSRERGRELFVRIASRLAAEFGALVVEAYGGQGEESKEYWTLQIGGSRLLLMRTFYPTGIALCGESWQNVATVEAVARAFGARPIGWRCRALRLRDWWRSEDTWTSRSSA